jgi:hypothetical protein
MTPDQYIYFRHASGIAGVILGLLAILAIVALSHPSKRNW